MKKHPKAPKRIPNSREKMINTIAAKISQKRKQKNLPQTPVKAALAHIVAGTTFRRRRRKEN
jgi:hypothetical protein